MAFWFKNLQSILLSEPSTKGRQKVFMKYWLRKISTLRSESFVIFQEKAKRNFEKSEQIKHIPILMYKHFSLKVKD